MQEHKRCAVVTGSSRGIGRAIALALSAQGYAVVVNYRGGRDAAESVVSEITASGGEALAVPADVSDYTEAGHLIQTSCQAFGGVYALVNNAGVTRDALLLRMKEEEFDAVIDTNLKGAWNCMRHVSPVMLKARQGRIVNIASVAGVTGNAGQTNYSAAKAGMIGMTKSAALELAPRGITVNALAPGLVKSDMTATMPEAAVEAMLARVPLKRMAEPHEIAAAVAFLISDAAAYITGQTLVVDGGLCMP